MCTETADNVLLPSVPVARVSHREAKLHAGRPPGVFEFVANAITSHVPPDPNPGDDMLLKLSPNHDHSNGASDRYAENADTAILDRCRSSETLPRVC